MDHGLKQRVLAKDWSVVDEAKRLGPGALAEFASVMGGADEEARELAITSIKQIGGEQAAEICAAAAKDPNVNVRSMAVACLDESATSKLLPELEALLTASPDEWVRAQVALVLGRIGGSGTAALLARRLSEEPDPVAVANLRLALARLGDEEQRAGLLDQLGSTQPEVRYQGLQKLAYVRDPRLLPPLLPLLDDEVGVHNIAPSHAPRRMMRVQDVVVNVTAEVTGHAFSFNAREKRLFTRAELDEVRAFLMALPR